MKKKNFFGRHVHNKENLSSDVKNAIAIYSLTSVFLCESITKRKKMGILSNQRLVAVLETHEGIVRTAIQKIGKMEVHTTEAW